jgi:Tol biopolymer transport system component
LLFRFTPGAGMVLTDISTDGKFLTFYSGGVVFLVELTGTDPLARKATEFAREEYDAYMGRFSPDGRLLAYISDETDKNEVYVKPVDKSVKGKWQVSKEGARGMVFWRADGKEMYYLNSDPKTPDMLVMAVDISATPAFEAGTPHQLFRLTGPLDGNPGQWKNISSDGQRFVFLMPDH